MTPILGWRRLFLIVCWISLLTGGCRLEQFIGYNYKSEPLARTIPVSGQVVNQFTGQPVVGARVVIGPQFTYSDSSGNFFLSVFAAPDLDRDKPVAIRVEANQYYPKTLSVVLYPAGNFFTIPLEYAAPIIQAALVNDSLCQAIVMDYQGVETLEEVLAIFRFQKGRQPVRHLAFPLQQVGQAGQAGYFQAVIDIDPAEEGQWLRDQFQIYARDRDGFSESAWFSTFDVPYWLF